MNQDYMPVGWLVKQQSKPPEQRMPLDQQLVCYNYAVMMRDRHIGLSDIGQYHGVSKEAVRQWFERGLPNEVLYKLDEAIHALRPMGSPDKDIAMEFSITMRDGYHQYLKDNEFLPNEPTGENIEIKAPTHAHTGPCDFYTSVRGYRICRVQARNQDSRKKEAP